MTCWRRLREWTEAGAWPALHEQLLDQLRARELDLDRCAVDGPHIRALTGGTTSVRPRSTAVGPLQALLIIDAGGIASAVTLIGGNRHDVTLIIPLHG